jgi:hypothetical protein
MAKKTSGPLMVKPRNSTNEKAETITSKAVANSEGEWEACIKGVTFPPLIKVPPLISREFLSSSSEEEMEETSAGDLACKIMKDLELSDSEGEENEKTVKKIDVEINETEAVIEKGVVQETNNLDSIMHQIIEAEERLLDEKIAEEEQAIKEIEAKLKNATENKELTCGGLELNMTWKLIPVSGISTPIGRREWLNTIAQEREEGKGNMNCHRNDPRFKLKCRKCKKRFISTQLCAKNGCPGVARQ